MESPVLGISVARAAQILGIGKTTAYRSAQQGDLPGVRRVGGRLVVAVPDLERFLGVESGEISRRLARERSASEAAELSRD